MKNLEIATTRHLYLHIPFCYKICSYCDFCRIKVASDDIRIANYIDLVIAKLRKESESYQYTTIYIGGGTPNFLNLKLLEKLLLAIQPYINTKTSYEFTIECNPELVNEAQVQLFKQHGVNRISLGVQTLNAKILKTLNRHHTLIDVEIAIALFQKHGIDNISCDFIYAIKNLTVNDIEQAITFAVEHKIPHLSYYALEIKTGSQLAQQHALVDLDIESDHLEYIKQAMIKHGYQRYEVSNWATHEQYESQHNKAYWLSNDWKAIGWGAHGFENNQFYEYSGSLLDWKVKTNTLSTKDLFFQIMMMGLRLVNGIDVVHNQRNRQAYAFYQTKIIDCEITDSRLKAKQIDLLHDTLLNLID